MKRLLSGRADRVIYNPKTGVVLVQDFKTGWSEPDPAEQNAQLKVLAVLAALHLRKIGVTIRKVVVQIISGPFGVFEATYELPDLAKAYNDIMVTLGKIHDPRAPLTPSPEACLDCYCPAINVCQAVKSLVMTVVRLQVSALPDGVRAAKLLDEVELLQTHLDAIREYYHKRFSEDPAYDCPGWGLQPGAVRREVTDWDTARQRLGEWLELDEINGAANYRLLDLEKALGRKLGLRGRELKERMNTILQGLVEERQNAASLKRVKGVAKLVTLELP